LTHIDYRDTQSASPADEDVAEFVERYRNKGNKLEQGKVDKHGAKDCGRKSIDANNPGDG
jgi:hypothetical protein